MSVVARERSEAHENVGRLDPTWGRVPIGGGVHDAANPVERRREMVHQVQRLNAQLTAIGPPGPIQGTLPNRRREPEAQRPDHGQGWATKLRNRATQSM